MSKVFVITEHSPENSAVPIFKVAPSKYNPYNPALLLLHMRQQFGFATDHL